MELLGHARVDTAIKNSLDPTAVKYPNCR